MVVAVVVSNNTDQNDGVGLVYSRSRTGSSFSLEEEISGHVSGGSSLSGSIHMGV